MVTENTFLSKTVDDQLDLTTLTIDDLAAQYIAIDQQSTLLKGQILLEARRRVSSDKEFGKWVSTHALCVGSQQSRNKLMHLADFFSGERNMEGITITAAYEISAPVNSDKSEEVYNKAHGNNLPVKEVKALLTEDTDVTKHHEKDNLEEQDQDQEQPEPEPEISHVEYEEHVQRVAKNLIDNVMKGESPEFRSDKFIKDVLKIAIQYLKERI